MIKKKFIKVFVIDVNFDWFVTKDKFQILKD